VLSDCTFAGDDARVEAARYVLEMARTLARFTFCAGPLIVGLEEFGRPGNYFERQIKRWKRQYEASGTARIEALDRTDPHGCPDNCRPTDGAVCYAHGDYRIGHLMFHKGNF